MNTTKKSVARRTTGRTTPKSTPDTPTSASSWKKGSVGGTLLSVPSGNTALVRSPGMAVFIEEGVIPNALLPVIQEAMTRGGPPTDAQAEEMMKDPEKIKQIAQLADAITVYCCLDPVVLPAPLDDDGQRLPMLHPKRNPDTLYVDEVDFNDKMYIFNFAVGGPAHLEKFRQELAGDVESVPGQ